MLMLVVAMYLSIGLFALASLGWKRLLEERGRGHKL
jgi:hypothetical protein